MSLNESIIKQEEEDEDYLEYLESFNKYLEIDIFQDYYEKKKKKYLLCVYKNKTKRYKKS
jgi:hypothetical protein